jgi:hypothetical protein
LASVSAATSGQVVVELIEIAEALGLTQWRP